MKSLTVAVVGAGQFSSCFIPLLRAHPGVREVVLCEQVPGRLQSTADRFGISRRYADYTEVLRARDIDAVALFTQRWLHGPMAVAALRAGKHVYSSVPAAVTLEELHELVETVGQTGLNYMLGETSLYYPSRLFCLEKWAVGELGRFVYGEGEYLHDMANGFYEAFAYSGGPEWKETASFPPMLYPTHSVSMVLSVTGARMTSVSCLGQEDVQDDGVFDAAISRWGNVHSNQTALFRTSDGGMVRINEFRRIGVSDAWMLDPQTRAWQHHPGSGRCVRVSLMGTKGAFEEQCNGAVWATPGLGARSVEPLLACGTEVRQSQGMEHVDERLLGDFCKGFAPIHRPYREKLPEAYAGLPNGHEGSHQFLMHEFVTSCLERRLPACSVWDAARYNAPGIVAHASALREGERLPVPDFGAGPA